ncbi:efflux transporter outer membrane subunit [Schlegelella koreensis]|uniref:Efflux transporter outer membrane subunit n=1 Tax=Piscinibacter koreensis TaxID=2742824 RepID=A0A7Y6NNV2_9BURK|nr:efflux transporter outer membrane subunit [Schlegelella koreensis]
MWRLWAGAAAAVLGACSSLPPPGEAPRLDLPPTWRVEPGWREAAPADAADKGRWWQRFNDPTLDALIERALANSQSIAAANARLAQARALVDVNAAALWPQLSLSTRVARQRTSANRPLSNYASPNFSTVQNDYLASLGVSYEVDLGGRVASNLEGARASAEQSAADLANVRLLVTTDLASAYVNLRALDIEQAALQRSIALQRRALDFISTRHELGAVSGLEVAQQQALLDSTLTQVDVLYRQRTLFKHVIATLTGSAAPAFEIAPEVREIEPPAIPLGVPSDVLERRPDVAAAERAMAVANAQIGVARAAFFPTVTLGPSIGVDSRTLGSLLDAPSLLWSLGVGLTQPLFDAGRLRANADATRAAYEASVANYRRIVLVAMQEVEDGIVGVAALGRAQAQARTARASAARVLDMATARYEGGASTYLDVITAQQSLLAADRQAAQLRGQQLLASVFLVKALGGDWQQPVATASR